MPTTDLYALSTALLPSHGYAPPMRCFERLFPFQAAAVDQFRFRTHPLLGHAPGLGKTAIALAMAMECAVDRRVIVVCPPSIAQQWKARGDEWGGWAFRVLPTGILVAGALGFQGNLIVPDSLVHFLPDRIECGALIIDEVHRMKTGEARRTSALFGRAGIARRADRVISLTGTPVINAPVDLYPLLSVIAPEFGTFEEYTARYDPPTAVTVPGRFRAQTVQRYGLQTQNLPELAQRLRQAVLIRPAAAHCMAQLPPLIHDSMHLHFAADPAEGQDQGDNLRGDDFREEDFERPAMATVRRESGLSKANCERFQSWLKTLVEGGDRPLVWCWHQDVAKAVAERMGFGLITGAVPIAQRQAALASFQSLGGLPGLALTIAAAGTGLDGLQHSGACCVFLERSYNPPDNEQAIARLHRMGQTRGVRVITVESNLACDYAIRNILERKERILREILS